MDWRKPDGMRMEDTGNLFGYEGWGINSDEGGLGEVGSVGVEVTTVAANSPPSDGQKERDVALNG